MSHYSECYESERKNLEEDQKQNFIEIINSRIKKLYYKDLIIIDKFIEKLESVKGAIEIIETITRS